MKTALFTALVLSAGLGLAPAWGQGASTALPRTLTMSGLGEVRAVPDTVTLTAGVSSQAGTAAAALSANTTHMQAVFAALKKLGIADKDIQTLNFNVSPQLTGGNNQPARVTGYQVNNEVRVTLNDVGRLGAALDALVSA
ncbi:MAG TPA: SIMPL domain-containing protein, partial [Rhizomicrobium sp.]|nr:SIMPL domain-containing protein [Rhizomicrobium sp.]